MSSAQDPSTIQYLPPPSTGHEIGVMFGFIGLMIVCELVFHTWFKMHMRKEERLEREKAEEYRAKGYIAQDQKVELGGNKA